MKKHKIISIMFLLFVFGFTACSSDSGDSNPTSSNEPSTYSISGSVVDQDGAAVPDYTVTLSGSKSSTTTTNSNGEYSFTNLDASKTYTVTVDNISYTIESLSSDETFNFQVVVSKSILISGTVTDLDDNPVQGVPLTFKDNDYSPTYEKNTTSDASGHYEFNAELTPGKIWVINTTSAEHRYGGYSDDQDVSGISGRGADEAAGSYRTTDVVVNFKQINDIQTTWSAGSSDISTNAQNDGIVSSTLTFSEYSCNWFLRDSNDNLSYRAVNTSYTITKSSSGNIHSVSIGSGDYIFEGIYEITKSNGTWTLKLEVVNTADGNTAPTVTGGFGSSNNGADGDAYVWIFTSTR